MENDVMNEDYSFRIKNEDGSDAICDALAVITAEGYDEPLIIYTDYTFNEEKKFKLFVSKLVGNEEEGFTLQDVENYQNIPEIQKALSELE